MVLNIKVHELLSEQSKYNSLQDEYKSLIPTNNIPDKKLEDTEYLKEKIEENRKISLGMRKEIRDYCFTNFDWSSIIKQYKEIINKL